MSHDTKRSASAAIHAGLDFPVIDTDVHTNDYAPEVEDYIAKYAGAHLVDELRKASISRLDRGGIGNGTKWYEQTPEERHYYRTLRSPWWARVTKNTLDVAPYHIPSLLYERQAEQGSDYSVLFPNNVLAPLAVKTKDARSALHRALNVITEADFHAWTFANPYKLYTEAKADFFAGTSVAEKLARTARVAAE